jgi:hypothetical protein
MKIEFRTYSSFVFLLVIFSDIIIKEWKKKKKFNCIYQKKFNFSFSFFFFFKKKNKKKIYIGFFSLYKEKRLMNHDNFANRII